MVQKAHSLSHTKLKQFKNIVIWLTGGHDYVINNLSRVIRGETFFLARKVSETSILSNDST